MAYPLSAHLRNAAILLLAGSVAVAADRFAGMPARSAPGARSGPAGGEDISRFVTPFAAATRDTSAALAVGADPLEHSTPLDTTFEPVGAAPSATPPARRQRLTAILVADNHRVAVIDDATVGVGDVLRDGSRVSSIQANRVWLVERTGQFRMLSLTPQGQ